MAVTEFKNSLGNCYQAHNKHRLKSIVVVVIKKSKIGV